MQFRVGICQMKVTNSKEANLSKAADQVRLAVSKGADLVVLPEMFTCPYQKELFASYAEVESNSLVFRFLSDLARESHCYLVGGSVPEQEGEMLYNTSYIFNRAGKLVGKHRKLHLFDIEIPGGISFKESAVLSSGESITTFETEFGRCGVAICYDLRFPELFRLMNEEDVKLVVVPAAFNLTTGPAHWETLFRARAIDNQLYMVGASPARDPKAAYVAYGHSLAVNPWGDLIYQADIVEEVGVVMLDSVKLEEIRLALPLLKHRRLDLYQVKSQMKEFIL